MKRASPALAALLALLAGCEWNERSASFHDRAEFAASDLGRGGFLPADLLPASARDIVVKRNLDTSEVEASFSFDPKEETALVGPFLNFEQLRLRLAMKEGIVPAGVVSTPQLLLRCGEGAMEFLEVKGHRRARYWTSWDKARRASACTNNATGVASQ
jgi:hypothetical protein